METQVTTLLKAVRYKDAYFIIDSNNNFKESCDFSEISYVANDYRNQGYTFLIL